MCNLSQGIRDSAYSEGVIDGKNQGILIGKNQGILIGKNEGILIGKSEGIAIGKSEGMVCVLTEMVRDGLLTGADAARRAGMTEKEFYNKARQYGMA